MMKNLKPTLLLAGIICLACSVALPARAQFFGGLYGSQSFGQAVTSVYNAGTNVVNPTTLIPLNTSGTNFVLPLATNSTVTAVALNNAHSIVLQVQAAGYTNGPLVSVPFVRSLDGVNWDTTPFCNLTVTPSGAGVTALASTNIDLGAYGYVCPFGFTNAATITNLAIRYAIKPGF
jgi:hypothetical protein